MKKGNRIDRIRLQTTACLCVKITSWRLYSLLITLRSLLRTSCGLKAAVRFCSYLDTQTLLSEPCRYEKNTAGRSERIWRKEGGKDV